MTGLAPPTAVQRWRTWRWVLLALVAVVAIAAVSTYLTAPRPGGRMDAESTSPDGTHALVTLLRDRGVDVVVANTVADVERAARPDSLLLVAETYLPCRRRPDDTAGGRPRRSAAGRTGIDHAEKPCPRDPYRS